MLDTPARHTRAQSRLQAAAQSRPALGPVREQPTGSSRPVVEDDPSSDSLIGAQRSGRDADGSDTEEGHSGLHEAARGPNIPDGTGVVWTTSEEEDAGEGESDEDSDSKDEEDAVGREQLGRMAERMLAALGSLDGLRQGGGSAGRAAHNANGAVATFRTGRDAGAAQQAAGPVRQGAGEEPDLDEVRWEPGLQLPPPVDSAEAAQVPAALEKAQVVPGKQVRARAFSAQ